MTLPPQQVALLFSEGAAEYAWWERHLDPAHCHVDTLVFTPGHGVLLESFAGALTITDLELHVARNLIAGWGGRVVMFRPGTRRRRSQWPVGITSCVTLAKAIIGCNQWRVITPLQLKRWALANGGYEIGSESP
jgi:hypothetical protein